MACRFCARRRRASEIEVLRREEVENDKSERLNEVAWAGASPVRSLGLRDLSEEVLSSVFRCLRATEVLTSLEPCSKFLQSILVFGDSSSLWNAFLMQEFPGEGRSPECADKSPKWLYRQLIQRKLCSSIEWRQAPVSRSLGAREGSPGLFYKNGYVFVFGGWGLGPMRDLHVAALQAPMQFREVLVQGTGPAPTYEAKTTVLEDVEASEESDTFRVIVTGGWRHGGYYEESGMYGIMEVDCSDSASGVKARWLRTGSMMPRANHSATYVPPRIAGPLYPDGYLLVFGGCINGANSDAMTLLDLSNYLWTQIDTASSQHPQPQNSHSATLVPCEDPDNPGSHGYAILFLGGGGGDDTNGGPPRGGRDFVASYWLRGLENAQFRWERCHQSSDLGGRGHVAIRLSGTDAVVMMGGGRPPLQRACAVSGSRSRLLEPVAKGPAARAFGGGCALPDGLAMVYGGWHPCKGTFSDVWVACFDDIGRSSSFFQQLPPSGAEEPEAEESADDMAFNLVIRRLFGQMEGMEGQLTGQEDEDSDSEEEADENDENSEDDTDEAEPQTAEDLQDLMDDLDSSAPLIASSDED